MLKKAIMAICHKDNHTTQSVREIAYEKLSDIKWDNIPDNWIIWELYVFDDMMNIKYLIENGERKQC